MQDARTPERRRADLERILHDDPPVPPRTMRVIGGLCLVLFVATVAMLVLARGAQLADDVENTRVRVERMEQCR
jgi:hypothetical protein